MDDLLYLLELHYSIPSLWDETPEGSALFGPLTHITKELGDAMERRHPGYRSHICAIAKNKGIVDDLFT